MKLCFNAFKTDRSVTFKFNLSLLFLIVTLFAIHPQMVQAQTAQWIVDTSTKAQVLVPEKER